MDIPSLSPTSASHALVTVPTPILSSAEVGWDGLLVRAFQEPERLERWVEPAIPDPTLVLFLQGAMRMESLQRQGGWYPFNFERGDLFLRPGTNVPREVRWQSMSPEPLQTLQIRLHREKMEEVAQAMAGRGLKGFSLTSGTAFRDLFLSQLGITLLRELRQGIAASRFYAQTIAQMLAAHLLHRYAGVVADGRSSSPTLTSRQLQRVCDYIHEHLHQDLSLDQLAREAGLSSYYFARLFRQMTGTSPHQFVLRQRISRAQVLLTASDLPLAAIALECGFANQSHLTHVFTRRVGTSPRLYRERPRNSAHFDQESATM